MQILNRDELTKQLSHKLASDFILGYTKIANAAMRDMASKQMHWTKVERSDRIEDELVYVDFEELCIPNMLSNSRIVYRLIQ
jgi:hypothetical protein